MPTSKGKIYTERFIFVFCIIDLESKQVMVN